MTDQLRADFATIEQAGSDLRSYAGTLEDYREVLRSEALKALGNFGGGAGSAEHEAAMRAVDRLVDEHVRSIQEQRSGLTDAGDTFRAAGSRMRSLLEHGS